MSTIIMIIISVFFALGFLAFFHNLIFIQYPRHRERLFKTFMPGRFRKLEAKRKRELNNGNKPILLPRTDGRGNVVVWAKSVGHATQKYNTYLKENKNRQKKEIFTKRKSN